MKSLPISPLAIVFIVLEAIAFAAFSYIDVFTNVSSIYIKYSAVLLCVVFSAIYAVKSLLLFFKVIKNNKPEAPRFAAAILSFFALVFTALADLYLLVLGKKFELGVCFFICAQVLHAVRIFLLSCEKVRVNTPRKSAAVCAGGRIIAFAAAFLIIYPFFKNYIIAPLAGGYFCLLLFNFAECFCLSFRDRRFLLITAGFLLFIFCDVCVGLFNLSSVTQTTLPKTLYTAVTYGMWFFYSPSQTLIALSCDTF